MIHHVVVGGTASGKKTVAAALHRRHGLRPLAMDSMKVYRGMDVGTDKPSADVRRATGYGLLDLVGHDESFTAGRWIAAAREEVQRTPGGVVFAGGTPLYLRLLVEGMCPAPPGDETLRADLEERWEREGERALRDELAALDPELEARLAPGDARRVLRGLEVARLTGRPLSAWQREETRPPLPGEVRVVALRLERDWHLGRLARRVDTMLDEGLVEETRSLAAGAPFAPEPGRSIGYAEALQFLAGTLTLEALRERIVVRTRQLVRKQRLFLASFPSLAWVDVGAGDSANQVVERVERALGL